MRVYVGTIHDSGIVPCSFSRLAIAKAHYRCRLPFVTHWKKGTEKYASIWYGYDSRGLVVCSITGTKLDEHLGS